LGFNRDLKVGDLKSGKEKNCQGRHNSGK
jgi:hypothetical protein